MIESVGDTCAIPILLNWRPPVNVRFEVNAEYPHYYTNLRNWYSDDSYNIRSDTLRLFLGKRVPCTGFPSRDLLERQLERSGFDPAEACEPTPEQLLRLLDYRDDRCRILFENIKLERTDSGRCNTGSVDQRCADAMISVVTHPRLGEVTLSSGAGAPRFGSACAPRGRAGLFSRGVSAEGALAVLDEKAEWIEAAREWLARNAPRCLRSCARGQKPASKSRAGPPKPIFRRVSSGCRSRRGLKYAKLTIRASRTKWGSCSGRNTISLSLFLMTLPEHLRDYVIVHELCHTVHHNHSPRFHALCGPHGRGQ